MFNYEKIVLRPVGDAYIKIDVTLIPEHQRRQLAEFALALTREVFSRPGEDERYQAWLKNRYQKERN